MCLYSVAAQSTAKNKIGLLTHKDRKKHRQTRRFLPLYSWTFWPAVPQSRSPFLFLISAWLNVDDGLWHLSLRISKLDPRTFLWKSKAYKRCSLLLFLFAVQPLRNWHQLTEFINPLQKKLIALMYQHLSRKQSPMILIHPLWPRVWI